MQLKTILNRVHKLKSFVYETIRVVSQIIPPPLSHPIS